MTSRLFLTILTAVSAHASIHITHGYLLNRQNETASTASYFPLVVLSTAVVYTLTLYQAKKVGMFGVTAKYEFRVVKALLLCVIILAFTPMAALLYWMIEYGSIIGYVQSHDWKGQFSSLMNWYLVMFIIVAAVAFLFSIRLKRQNNKEVQLNKEYR